MTEWVLHFIRDCNDDDIPDDSVLKYDYYETFPYHENKELNDRFDSWRISDEGSPLASDASAFHVLMKIISDGHIRSNWAFRKRRATIYGPRPAACFTEMPLYALVEYAKTRNTKSVGSYATGVLKKELYQAGGRPAIYRLSKNHVERRPAPSFSWNWPRKLHPSCEIGEAEQYRYVAMSMSTERPIDWSHEREWRWADHLDQCSCPGLPVWLDEEPFSFSRVMIVVPKSSEVKPVLDLLKSLHDAGGNDYDQLFSRKTLAATSVVSLEELEARVSDLMIEGIRLEDIPASQIQRFKTPQAAPELIEKVRSVLAEAKQAADGAAAAYLVTARRTPSGHVADVAGWAHLVIHDAQSPLVSALSQLGECYSIPGTGHYVSRIGDLGWGNEQALSVAEAAVTAGMDVFRKHFPEVSFSMETRWD